MICYEKAEFGQISRSFALNSGAIRLKRPKNLTQIGFPSLRSVKPDRLLGEIVRQGAGAVLQKKKTDASITKHLPY